MRKIPPPCKGGTSQASADDGLTGLGNIIGDVDLGLRSQTRFSPGFHIPGFQPSAKVSCQNHADAIIRCRHSTENSEEPCQRHCADGHPQFSLGKEGLNLLNLAGRKLHHFCTVSAPLVRLRVVQFFGRGVRGGAVVLLDYRFQLGHELAAVLTFRLATTDHGTVEDLRGQPRESAAGAHGTVEGGQRLGEIVDARATAHPAHGAPNAAARERTAETRTQATSERMAGHGEL